MIDLVDGERSLAAARKVVELLECLGVKNSRLYDLRGMGYDLDVTVEWEVFAWAVSADCGPGGKLYLHACDLTPPASMDSPSFDAELTFDHATWRELFCQFHCKTIWLSLQAKEEKSRG